MASDTNTKKTDIDQLLDLYWGGPERRITGITLRIIAVNAVALMVLIAGIVFLGQYQQNLIETKLESFKTKVELTAATLSQTIIVSPKNKRLSLNTDALKEPLKQIYNIAPHDIFVFNAQGNRLIRTVEPEEISYIHTIQNSYSKKGWHYFMQSLRSTIGIILRILPDYEALPYYPDIRSGHAKDYPGVTNSLEGSVNLAAWNSEAGIIYLSGAAPLRQQNKILGSVFIRRAAHDINEDIGTIWLNILQIFLFALGLTIMLSIYLSGVIARPLKKLVKVTENIRKGKASYRDLPDMSDRHDEIGELSMALTQMTKALWDRMDSIDSFAADVAHELKNPLTSLRSALETAMIVKKKSDRDKLFIIIRHDLERMDRLITDISKASRLDAELSREEVEKININKLLKSIVKNYNTADTIKKKTKNKKTQIFYNGKDNADIYVWGQENRLIQVFENLLSNALSFSKPQDIITIRVTQKTNTVCISVTDQGPGIPHVKLQTIFDRFYSQRPDHEAYGHHSGLGLSICKQIIKTAGGKIFAENIKNNDNQIKGAKFNVILRQA